jgi:biotin carboxyl carrier protein
VTSQLAVQVGSTPLLVGLNGRRRQGKRDDSSHTTTGPQRVVAPMPGKIVRVLVHRGQTVATRQPLVVVEAMKMENELRAGRDGTVAEIHAQEGRSVDAGALLVIIQ